MPKANKGFEMLIYLFVLCMSLKDTIDGFNELGLLERHVLYFI